MTSLFRHCYDFSQKIPDIFTDVCKNWLIMATYFFTYKKVHSFSVITDNRSFCSTVNHPVHIKGYFHAKFKVSRGKEKIIL